MNKSLVFIMSVLVLLQAANSTTWKTYDSTNGLIRPMVSALLNDTRGNIWIISDFSYPGNKQIISKFNGTKWEHFDSVVVANADTTAICNPLKNTTFNISSCNCSKQKLFVTGMAADMNGNVWFSGAGIFRFSGSDLLTSNNSNKTPWFKYDQQASGSFTSIVIDKNNRKWFGTREYCTCACEPGGMTFPMQTGRIFSFNDTTFAFKGYYKCGVNTMAVDSLNRLWVGGQGTFCTGVLYNRSIAKVMRYDGIEWKTITKSDGIIDTFVNSIKVDAAQNVWFGTNKCVSMYDGTNWVNYTTADGLISNCINVIAIDKQQNKWFGTSGGVSKFNGTTWTNYTTANGLANNFVSAIAIDSTGRKWFGTQGGGVSVLSDDDTPVLDKKSQFQPSNLKIKYSNGRLAIDTPEEISNAATIQLYTANGRLVLAKSITSKESDINTADLSPGLYLVRFCMGKTIISDRFIK